jgi:CubicO group peptidase (beta-lactamase class C family)
MSSAYVANRRAVLAGFGALALPQAAWARAPEGLPALQAMLDSYVTSKKLPGGAATLVRANQPTRFAAAGTTDFDSTKRVGRDTLFRIYSMTKPIVGFATLKLVEEGRLRLDQPVAEVIPEFRNLQVLTDPNGTETRAATKPMLIRHLLTHSAGFGYSISNNAIAKLYIKNGITPGSRAAEKEPGADLPPVRTLDELAQRLSKLPLSFDPGARWQYSVSFDVLGLVIQRASGMPFHDYLQSRIFRPLKMVDTDFMVPKNKIDRFVTVVGPMKDGAAAIVEDRLSSPFTRDRDLPSGGGGLVSTAQDYARFMGMLVNEGTLDRVRVAKPETVRTFGSNLLEPGVFFGGKNGYGGGVSVVLPGGERPGGEPVGAYSWFGIAGSQMWVDPANKAAVALMVNYMPFSAYPLPQEVRAAAYKDLALLKA